MTGIKSDQMLPDQVLWARFFGRATQHSLHQRETKISRVWFFNSFSIFWNLIETVCTEEKCSSNSEIQKPRKCVEICSAIDRGRATTVAEAAKVGPCLDFGFSICN